MQAVRVWSRKISTEDGETIEMRNCLTLEDMESDQNISIWFDSSVVFDVMTETRVNWGKKKKRLTKSTKSTFKKIPVLCMLWKVLKRIDRRQML